MIRRLIGGVTLAADEEPIKAWDAQTETWGRFASSGTLNLTSRRLIWIREGLNLVPRPPSVVVRLDDIENCSSQDWLGVHIARLRMRDGSRRTFRLFWGIRASELVKAINELRRKRGLLDD
jgi:hypothetical protein